MASITEVIKSGIEWLSSGVDYYAHTWFHDSLMAMASTLNGMFPASVSTWISQANLSGIPSGMYWILSVFQVPSGLSIVMIAYGIRFLIRRIPVIG